MKNSNLLLLSATCFFQRMGPLGGFSLVVAMSGYIYLDMSPPHTIFFCGRGLVQSVTRPWTVAERPSPSLGALKRGGALKCTRQLPPQYYTAHCTCSAVECIEWGQNIQLLSPFFWAIQWSNHKKIKAEANAPFYWLLTRFRPLHELRWLWSKNTGWQEIKFFF